MNTDDKKEVEQIVGSVLYYAYTVYLTILIGLSSIASKQADATTTKHKLCRHMLDYLATNSNATIRYHASKMILNIHSDASYLSEPNAKSRASGHFFLAELPVDGKPILLNGAIHTLAVILKFVAASAAEAELGALFLVAKYGRIIRVILEELGHPQPPTPIHCDNKTTVGIANDTVKRQRSRSMEMRYFWIVDQVTLQYFKVGWYPGQEILADYTSKHFEGRHHINVRPIFLHCNRSPRYLPWALSPSTLRGCVGISPGGYSHRTPLHSWGTEY